MISLSRSPRLAAALFRFVAEDIVRGRRSYFAAVLGGYAVFELLTAVAAPDGLAEGFGSRFILVSLIASAPLCRPWLSEDVRLGYAALWLQKPLGVFEYYLARILAVVAWSVAATLAIGLASVPASIGAASLTDIAGAILALGWIPTALAVLGFLGSALGARNSGLFAYAALFAGFALPGLREAIRLGPVYRVLELALPPAFSALQANTAFKDGDLLAAVAALRPLLVYLLVCLALALSLAVLVPRRLTRA